MKIIDVNDNTRSISLFVWLGAYPFYLLFQVLFEVSIAVLGIVQYSYSLQRKEHALKRRQLQNRHCALRSTKEVISRKVDTFYLLSFFLDIIKKGGLYFEDLQQGIFELLHVVTLCKQATKLWAFQKKLRSSICVANYKQTQNCSTLLIPLEGSIVPA